jgi:hypothetical protein
MRKMGRELPFPTLHPLKTSPSSVTSSVSNQGSSLSHVGQNGPRRVPGHRPTQHHSLVSRWYLQTRRG